MAQAFDGCQGSRTTRLVFDAADESKVEYEIRSVGDNETKELLHARGQASLNVSRAPAHVDLRSIRRRMQQGRVAAQTVYEDLDAHGLVYGPAHRSVRELLLGEGELLAALELPSEVDGQWSNYRLHPSLLDGALQSGMRLVDAAPGELWLPHSVQSVRIWNACQKQMWAWVRRQVGSTPLRVDIDLIDAQGVVSVQMSGLMARRSRYQARSRRSTDELATVLFTPKWVRTQVEGQSLPARRYGAHRVLVCSLGEVDERALARELGLDEVQVTARDAGQPLAERYEAAAQRCLLVLQEILQEKPESAVLVQVVVEGSARDRVFAGLWGLLKTAAEENPQILGQLVVTSPGVDAAQLAGQLRQEAGHARPGVIEYASGVRWERQWHPEALTESAPVVFKEGGVYLITGGLGGLGRVFVQEILRQSALSRVIVTGRSELTEERRQPLQQWGARVQYRQLDLQNRAAVRQALQSIAQEHGAVNGILHSAGQLADSFLLKKTAGQMQQVLEPKVQGTLNLDEASRDLGLDFLVLFSSVASVLGNLGQGDYAAANGFMDEYARYRNELVKRGERSGQTLSLNWPLWRAGGMQIDEPGQQWQRQRTGLVMLETEAGLTGFYRAMSLGAAQVLVGHGEIQRLEDALLQVQAPPAATALPAQSDAPPSTVNTSTPPSTGDLQLRTQEYLREQLVRSLEAPRPSNRRTRTARDLRHRLDPGHEADPAPGGELRPPVQNTLLRIPLALRAGEVLD